MKLIALDLDGTTLNSNHEISEENIRAIKKAQDQGHVVMILSGRTPHSINGLLSEYGLNCPIGGNNGTAVFADDKLIELTSLNSYQAHKIADVLKTELAPYNFSTNDDTFAPEDWTNRLENVLSSGKVPNDCFESKFFTMFTTPPSVRNHTIFNDLNETLNNKDLVIQKFFILSLIPEQKARLISSLESIEDVYVTGSSTFNLEVMNAHGNKGNGLKAMANYLNIPMEDTIAIGDQQNDIPMFKAAGLSIAMGNADETARKYAHKVTLTNDENGVAYAIENYVL